MMSALALAGHTDRWGDLFDAILQSEMLRGWDWFQFSYLVDNILKHRPRLHACFTQQQRLVFLEKLFEMARVANVALASTEAKVLDVCLQGAEDPQQIISRFEELSECSPDVVKELLKCDPLRAEEQDNLDKIPDEPMLRWIASLCPYSDEAALAFVEHVAAGFLQQNDWAALKELAVECSSIDLSWMEKLADAVLESERSEPQSGL
jgi:hypothetical protein